LSINLLHRYRKNVTTLLLTAILFGICYNKTGKKTRENSLAKEAADDDSLRTASQQENQWLVQIRYNGFPFGIFPIPDSTRFGNFENTGMPDTGLLKKSNFDPRCKDAANFRLNYKIPFPEISMQW